MKENLNAAHKGKLSEMLTWGVGRKNEESSASWWSDVSIISIEQLINLSVLSSSYSG